VRSLAIDLSPLRASRDFRLLWPGELVSQIGSQFTLVALFFQVYAVTGSSIAVGLIGLVQLVPMSLVSIGFGPQIDRRDRRRILIGAQSGLMVASALLLYGSVRGNPPLALLYTAAALNGAFLSIAMPTRGAMTPNLIPARLLPQAAALNQVMWNGAGLVGPALLLAGLVITFAIPGISVGGHLGGAVVGAICGWVMLAPHHAVMPKWVSYATPIGIMVLSVAASAMIAG